MKTIITGGAGFIGSKLAQACIDLNHEVTVVDSLITGFRDNVPDGADFLELDVSDETYIDKLPKNCDYFFHLASNSSSEISYEKPYFDLKSNTIGTLAALNYCKQVNVKKFVYTSSMNIYGECKDLPVTESTPPNPLSYYAVSKLASEHYINIFSKAGLNTSVLRLFNVYGPGQNLKNLKQGMISIYLAQLLNTNKIEVKGSLERFRDFIYIDDVISALLKTINAKNTNNIYNICSNKFITVEQLLDKLINLYNPKSTPDIHVSNSTPNDQFGIYGDNTIAMGALDWSPTVSLENGLLRMIKWAKSEINKG